MRLTLKSEWLPLVFVAASWALFAYFWPRLPDVVPTHWGLSGQPNQWAPKLTGALIGPVTATGLYFLMTLIPFIDPRSRHWTEFSGIYPVLKSALTAFMVFLTYMTYAASVAPSHNLPTYLMSVAIGLLYIILGNYLPKVRSN